MLEIGDTVSWEGALWISSQYRLPTQRLQNAALWSSVLNGDPRFYFDYKDIDMYLIDSREDIWVGSRSKYGAEYW